MQQLKINTCKGKNQNQIKYKLIFSMPTPQITQPVFYIPRYDILAKPPGKPLTNDPTAAIITAILPGSPAKVNLIVFPDGRAPANRESVPYFTDVTTDEPVFKFVSDPNALYLANGETIETACEPVSYSWKYFTGELETGAIIFTDIEMTTPYIDTPAVVNFENGNIYEVNQTTGELTEAGNCSILT